MERLMLTLCLVLFNLFLSHTCGLLDSSVASSGTGGKNSRKGSPCVVFVYDDENTRSDVCKSVDNWLIRAFEDVKCDFGSEVKEGESMFHTECPLCNMNTPVKDMKTLKLCMSPTRAKKTTFSSLSSRFTKIGKQCLKEKNYYPIFDYMASTMEEANLVLNKSDADDTKGKISKMLEFLDEILEFPVPVNVDEGENNESDNGTLIVLLSEMMSSPWEATRKLLEKIWKFVLLVDLFSWPRLRLAGCILFATSVTHGEKRSRRFMLMFTLFENAVGLFFSWCLFFSWRNPINIVLILYISAAIICALFFRQDERSAEARAAIFVRYLGNVAQQERTNREAG
jgi:hypothetical protein